MTCPIPETMRARRLRGHGGPEVLRLEEVPVPRPGQGEVLIRAAAAAAALNNTDVNTRFGRYAKSVRGGTGEGAAGKGDAGGWAGAIDFSRIQGADCCGRIVALGEGVDPARLGERVLVRALQTTGALPIWTFGSECDGAFAEYVVAPASAAIRPVALGRAVGNLIDNALRYAGSARVSLAWKDGAAAVIAVEDDGPGIAPARLRDVREPFMHGEASRQSGSGGAGLGLSIARAVARTHGGELRLANRAEGGLRAEIRLPAL